jgi:hypothetical protein
MALVTQLPAGSAFEVNGVRVQVLKRCALAFPENVAVRTFNRDGSVRLDRAPEDKS